MVLGAMIATVLIVPAALWFSLTHQPDFYRKTSAIPIERRHSEAKRFVAQSLQLRNDIVNEPRWEAVFTDEQVNSWLSEDLVEYFSDQIPQGVTEPRILFELDRIHFGFQLDQGPVRSIVSVVGKARVLGDHQLAITIEKIRAGVVPIPANQLLDKITEAAQAHGLEIHWGKDGEFPMAIVKYTPNLHRRDVILDRLQVLDGQIRLAGRSNKGRSVASPSLPSRRALQGVFPGSKKKDQPPPASRENMAWPFS